MKLDVLVVAAHPDDAELGAGGSIVKCVQQGHAVGILDLSRGELGTRGTPELRAREASRAAEVLGIPIRLNAGLPDGFLHNSKEHQLAIIPYIRRLQPRIVLANAVSDRHPDHGRAATLVSEACFLSGLRAIATTDEQGQVQAAWRPESVYHFIQDRYLRPDFIVDISDEFARKMDAVQAYESQFYRENAGDKEPQTPISGENFLKSLEARAREYGRLIGTTYGEGFTCERPVGLRSFSALL